MKPTVIPIVPVQASAAGGGCASSGCGSAPDALAHLPDAIRRKVQDHPCYSEQAHHYFARMHVAVAPACNIQCHYCNRKFDCANESRPGVVSELLTPEQAVKKTLAVAAAIPQMTVLGIAGPGDPLANPERTFATFAALAAKAPDIKLCVSTNGLRLPEFADEIARHNIDHVTITINCVDPGIGARIYPWIYWNHRRLRGVEAARILIEQQQKGLEMLVAKGILVKVNSVLIPGVNDAHLKAVSKIVKAKGAFLHNVMPLIAEAGHGTYYGVMGQRGPTGAELQALQDDCAGDMAMMRHCRQCRADAVGMLGEDRGSEFSLDKVDAMEVDYAAALERRKAVQGEIAAKLEAQRQSPKLGAGGTAPGAAGQGRPVLMAVASTGGGVIDQHFGHAKEFLIYEASAMDVRFIGHRKTDLYCSGNDSCGEGESVLARTIRTLAGCEAVLCARIGYEPWSQLEAAGIAPNAEHALEGIEAACAAVWREMLAAGKLAAPAAATARHCA